MSLLNQLFLLLVVVNMSKLHIGKNGMQGHEMVMSSGMSISINNKTGNITVEALDGLLRKFYWDDKIRQAKMMYRSERWYGAYGAYSPGGRSDVHMVIEEGQQHFCSQLEAQEWLIFQDPKMNFIFTKDGLVVGWYKEYNRVKNGHPDILNVEIFQLYVLGKKPVDLPNAQDSLFTITYSKDYVDKVKIGQFQPNTPKMIEQRMYSGKSIDMMEERGITPKQVENCIEKGKIRKKGDYPWYSYFPSSGGMLFVTIDKDGRVVRVVN